MTMLTEIVPDFTPETPLTVEALDGSGLMAIHLADAEQDSGIGTELRQQAAAQLGRIMDVYVSIEQVTYKNGVNHLYGTDDQHRKYHLGYDKVLTEFGHSRESVRERKQRLQRAIPVTPDIDRPPRLASLPTADRQPTAPFTPPRHITPAVTGQPARKPVLRTIKSWVGDVIGTARARFADLPLIGARWRNRTEQARNYYDLRPSRKATARKVGEAALIILGIAGTVLAAAEVARTRTVVVEQLFPTPDGFNGDGSVACEVVAHPEYYAQCAMEGPRVAAYRERMDAVISPHHQITPAAPITSPHADPSKIPQFSTLSRRGDSVWSAMESISLNGRHLKPAHIAEATAIELEYNHIPAERAGRIALNTRLRTAPAVARMLLADARSSHSSATRI